MSTSQMPVNITNTEPTMIVASQHMCEASLQLLLSTQVRPPYNSAMSISVWPPYNSAISIVSKVRKEKL